MLHLEGALLPVILMPSRTAYPGWLHVGAPSSPATSHTSVSALHPVPPCSLSTLLTIGVSPNTAVPVSRISQTVGSPAYPSDTLQNLTPHTLAGLTPPDAHGLAVHSTPVLLPHPSVHITGRSVALYTPPPHLPAPGIDTWDRTPYGTCIRRRNVLTF